MKMLNYNVNQYLLKLFLIILIYCSVVEGAYYYYSYYYYYNYYSYYYYYDYYYYYADYYYYSRGAGTGSIVVGVIVGVVGFFVFVFVITLVCLMRCLGVHSRTACCIICCCKCRNYKEFDHDYRHNLQSRMVVV